MEINNRCLQCGGDLKPHPKTGVPVCIYCGREHKATIDDYSYEILEIVHRRQIREFIQAEELCKALIEKHPDSAEAYWQGLLSSLGVVYIQDENGAKPTFFSYSYTDKESIKNNEYYINAINNAKSSEDKSFYVEKATELDMLLREFFDLVAKEKPYDIFISFKKSTNAIVDGEKRSIDTDDYLKAKEIYNHLKDTYNVFFSPVSIGEDTGIEGEKYEPRILKALQTSQAMILIGSKKEYLEAQWVENEWKRYQYFIDKGVKKKQSLIFGYLKSMPSLPAGLKDIQLPSFDMFSYEYLKDLDAKLKFVKSGKGLQSAIKQRKSGFDALALNEDLSLGYSQERVQISGGGKTGTVHISPTEQRDLDTAYILMENGQFTEAIAMFSSILYRSPNNIRARYCRFCAQTKKNNLPCIKNIKKQYLDDIVYSLENADDVAYAWEIIDSLILAISEAIGFWEEKRMLFEVFLKYLDDARLKKVLEILLTNAKYYISIKKINIAQEIYEFAHSAFSKENNDTNLWFLKEYALFLQTNNHFSLAQKCYENILGYTNSSRMYLNLLKCRCSCNDLTRNKIPRFNVDTSDDASKKSAAELDLDEIIERIILCNNDQETLEELKQIAHYQIISSNPCAKDIVEIIYNSYIHINANIDAISFLHLVGNSYLQNAKFDEAKIYFRELTIINANDSAAHWGLLKCRLKAMSDADVAKVHGSLLTYEEFNNARNCASEEEYKRYMEINNGVKFHDKKSIDAPYSSAEIKQHIFITALFVLIPLIVFFINVLFIWSPNTFVSDVEQSEGLEIKDGYVVGIGTCTDKDIVIDMPVSNSANFGLRSITFGKPYILDKTSDMDSNYLPKSAFYYSYSSGYRQTRTTNVGTFIFAEDDVVQSEGLEIKDGKVIGIGTCTDTDIVIDMPVAYNAFGKITLNSVTFGKNCFLPHMHDMLQNEFYNPNFEIILKYEDIEQSKGLEIYRDAYVDGIGACMDADLYINMPISNSGESEFKSYHRRLNSITFGKNCDYIGTDAFERVYITEIHFKSAIPPKIYSADYYSSRFGNWNDMYLPVYARASYEDALGYNSWNEAPTKDMHGTNSGTVVFLVLSTVLSTLAYAGFTIYFLLVSKMKNALYRDEKLMCPFTKHRIALAISICVLNVLLLILGLC